MPKWHYFITPHSQARSACWQLIAAAPWFMRPLWRTVARCDRVHEWAHETLHRWSHPETPNGVLRTHCARHYGEPVRLRRGACVLPGDTILVVHFTEKAIALGFEQAHTLAYDDLCYIAQWLKEGNARLYGIAAVHCQAILAPTLKAGGFELHPFTGYKEPWLRLYLEGWIILFHRKGIARFARGCQPVVNGWQSLRDLLELAERLRSGQPPH